MESHRRKKIDFLVVDTSAFINKAPIQEIGEKIVTTPQVIEEIKSKRQLRRLIVLPFDLEVKEAFPEHIKFVIEFSKKTGDYPSLSATDINVIALTYQFEKQKIGINHLNSAPVCRPTIEPTKRIPVDLKKIAGFYVPEKKHLSQTNLENSKRESDAESVEAEEYESAKEEIDFSEKEEDVNEILSCGKVNYDDTDGECKNQDTVEKEEEEEVEEHENDSGWITLNNIDRVKNQIAGELREDYENVAVACLTTDFAMQNVLKQIGLQVVSADGKIIKQLRTFILRCYGCFKTTSIMTKIFCPNCGNKTLKKVAVSIDADGKEKFHINFRKPLTARGKRFSLPHFKGGKHSRNPILFEDQPMPQQRPSHLSRTKNNPLNDDYIAGYSPFVIRDVTSKSAMLGIKPHLEMKHSMRKNPNESRRKKK